MAKGEGVKDGAGRLTPDELSNFIGATCLANVPRNAVQIAAHCEEVLRNEKNRRKIPSGEKFLLLPPIERKR